MRARIKVVHTRRAYIDVKILDGTDFYFAPFQRRYVFDMFREWAICIDLICDKTFHTHADGHVRIRQRWVSIIFV